MRQWEVCRLETGCRLLNARFRRVEIPSPLLAEETQAHRQSQVHEVQLCSPGTGPFPGVLALLERENTSSPAVVKEPPLVLAMGKATAGSRSSSTQNWISFLAVKQH